MPYLRGILHWSLGFSIFTSLETSHRESLKCFVVSNHPPFALLPQVPKGIESRGFVEFFLVYPMRSLDLSVVLRGSWADAFVVYTSLRQKCSRKFGASLETDENPFPLAYDLSEN